MLFSLLFSLALTICTEITVSISAGIRSLKDLLLICTTQILTNPPVVFFAIRIAALNNIGLYWFYIFIIETSIIPIEGYIYKKYLTNKSINPYRLSALNNIASYGIGVLLGLIS